MAGTTIGWTSPEIPKFKTSRSDGNPLLEPVTTSEESWIGSLLPVGATIGPFLAGFLAEKIGRKKTLLLGNFPFIIAFFLVLYAETTQMLFAIRFIFGLSVGLVFTVLPMYIGEIAEDEVRDTLGSFMQLFVVIGLLFSFCLGPYLTVKNFNITCLIPPILFLILFYMLIPESPYYLIRNNETEAEKALMKLRNKSKEGVQDELKQIKISVDDALANTASFVDIFKSKGLTKALTISVGLIIFQQLSGINIVLFYAQNIFTDAGSTIPADISTIILGVVQVISCGITPILVEKKGKKYLLILSGIGMAISLGILSVFFYIKSSGSDIKSIAFLPVLSLVLFIITFCFGFGPLPWAVMGEMFPGNVKSSASTATASCSWFMGFLLTKYFSLLTSLIGPAGSFGMFALCCLLAAGFVHKYLPDTSGKSLQEIQDMLNEK